MSGPEAPAVGARLAGRLIAVSVSQSEDLATLGHPSGQLARVLRAVLVPLVADGARIAYGGRIKTESDNYTEIISNELAEAYRRLDQQPGNRPFVHFVAQHRLSATEAEDLVEHLKDMAPYGEMWVTDPTGVVATFAALTSTSDRVAATAGCGLRTDVDIDEGEGPEWLQQQPLYRALTAAPTEQRDSFAAMRQQMAERCDARIQVGGRKSGFAGPISGLCEEALRTIDAGKPLYVLGGFGGASRDIAIALGLLDASDGVPRQAQSDEARYVEGLRRLRDARGRFDALIGEAERDVLEMIAGTESLVTASELLATQLTARLGS